MRMTQRFGLMCLVTVLALMGLAAAPADAQTPIGPGQHFVGLVNGSNDDPIVYTVCPGPSRHGEMGAVAGGQTLSTAEVRHGAGYTGLFSSIYAWFVPRAAAPRPPSVTFAEYGVAMQIPGSVRVPCDGRGQVEFSSCPYLAPCAYGWVPDHVRVTFENIAV